tara:strand:- start:2507 stop:3130 length:624 start_codon:yes stop_codon:yes gene_type:complete
MYFFLSTDSVNNVNEDTILISLSYSILDNKYNIILTKSFILKSDQKQSKEVNKIIESFNKIHQSQFEYINQTELYNNLIEDARGCKFLVSHFNDHHTSLVVDLFDYEHKFELFKGLINIDILRNSMPFTRIRMHRKGNRLKIPSPKEVYHWLFNESPNQTNSFFHIPTLIKCFRELDRRGLIHQNYKSIDYVDDLVKSKLNFHISSD